MKQIIGKTLIYLSILVIYINIASVLNEDKGITGQVKLQVAYQETHEVVEIKDEPVPGGDIDEVYEQALFREGQEKRIKWIVSSGMFLIFIVILLEKSKNKTK